MKATLEFDLNNPDDVAAHLRCISANSMENALFEISNNLTRRWKHSEKEPTLDEVMDAIYDILNQNNLTF
jgi:hypothetical protein